MTGINNRSIKSLLKMSVLCLGVFIGILFYVRIPASAHSGISITEVDYDKSLIKVQLTGEDSRVYISDGKMKKWDYVPTAKSNDGTITFDISWISPSKDYTLSIKGDASTEPVQIVIPKQNNKFKVTYEAATGLVKYVNDEGRAVQWKKKNGYQWNNAGSAEELQRIFSSMIANGAVISFRLAPQNGSGTDGGLRPGKEVNLTIPKKTAAPKITVNDSLMAIPVVKGMEYRYTDENGIVIDSGNWILIDKTENRPLSEIAPNAIYKGTVGADGNYSENSTMQDQYIQFRLQASGSRQISNNTTVKIPAQVVLSEEEINSFSLDYKSSSSFSIKAGKASSTNIYEYCIINTNDIEAGIGLDKPEELTWKDITSSDAVNISNTKNSCDDGSLIYIRRKAVKSLGDDDYKLASNTYLLETIKYPGNVAMDENCQLDSIAGVCRSDNSEGYLSFSFFSPGSGAVTRLKFGTGENDMKEIGTSDFKSVVTANEGANKEEYGYIIKTTIYSTSALEKYLAADAESVTLNGIYCIGDGTEFCTLEESLVSLTLHRASKVIVPGEVLKAQIKTSLPGLTDIDRIGYTKSIERVYLSNRTAANGFTEDADQNVFRTVIKLGDSSSINNNQDSVISGIKYAGIDLTEEHYKVYEMTDDTSAHNDKYLIVEFYADLIEQDPNITIRDESAAIVILLKNGERLSDVTMKLVSSARLSAGCTGASINPELIEETQNVTTTVNQVPTSVSQPNRDYYLEYELNIPGYTGLIVTNAIFMNTSVLLDTDSANGRVYLSVAKMKEIMQNKTETQSGNVMLIFNNGFKITKGYSLTLIK